MKITSSFFFKFYFFIGIVLTLTCSSCATSPSSKGGFCYDGNKAYENRNWDSAVYMYNQAIEADKTDSSDNFLCVFQYRPLAYARKGKYTEAIADANLMVTMRPNDLRSYLARCEVLSRHGAHQEALADCETALKMIPSNSIKIMIMPGTIDVKSFYALALIRAGNIDEGLALIEATVKKSDIPQYILFAKAEALDESGRYKDALLAYKEAISTNEDFGESQKGKKAARAIYGGVLGYLATGKTPGLSEGKLEFAKRRISELEGLK